MRFWDASAILPLCLQEPRTAVLRTLIDADSALVLWWGTPVECWSALARLRREGILDQRAEVSATQS